MHAGRFGWNFAVLGAARRALIRVLAVVGVVLGLVAIAAGTAGEAGASPATAPAAPSAPGAQGGQSQAMVTWVVPANNGSPITGFLIQAFHGNTVFASGVAPAGAVGSSLDPTPGAVDWYDSIGEPAGTGVTFTVSAVNAIGTGAASPQSASVTPTATPSAPFSPLQFVATTPSNYTVTLHWIVAPNNGQAITSFGIFWNGVLTDPTEQNIPVGAVGSNLDPTPGAHDSYTFGNLAPGQYDFSIDANNGIGLGTGVGVESPPTVTGPYFTQSAVPYPWNFGIATLGDYVPSPQPDTWELHNIGNVPDSINNVSFGGADPDDFLVDVSGCQNVQPNQYCTVHVIFQPGALGLRTGAITLSEDATFNTSLSAGPEGAGTIGYYQFGAAGEVGNFGDAGYYGDASSVHLNKPIVGMAQTGDDGGYWLVASDGGIFSFGDAQFFGSTGAIHLNKPIVGMAPTGDAGGYWLVASDGGIFAFGDAPFYGSTGSIRLNKPIVGMAPTPDGGGYWLVASDGGIFSFGDAQFYGSTGAITLNKPIVGMAATPDGGGYWMVASDGGIFAFGDAKYYGSTGAIHTPSPIKSMAAMPDGGGYWLTDGTGDVYYFGDAPNLSSVASLGVDDVVGIVTDGEPTLQAFLGVPAERHHSIAEAGGHVAHALSHRTW